MSFLKKLNKTFDDLYYKCNSLNLQLWISFHVKTNTEISKNKNLLIIKIWNPQ